jgi:hypothetical protein
MTQEIKAVGADILEELATAWTHLESRALLEAANGRITDHLGVVNRRVAENSNTVKPRRTVRA